MVCLALVLAATLAHAATEGVDITPDGDNPDGATGPPDISGNGRFVVFSSAATNLVDGDDNGTTDIFRRDLDSEETELVSVAADGEQANDTSRNPSVSDDGRFIVFESRATNLSSAASDDDTDIFLKDMADGSLTVVNEAEDGSSPRASRPRIADGGDHVALISNGLVADEETSWPKIYVWDRESETHAIASFDNRQREVEDGIHELAVDASGRRVSYALRGGGVYVFDLVDGRRYLASRYRRGRRAFIVNFGRLALSGNGRVVAYTTTTALVPGDQNKIWDVYAHVVGRPRSTRLMSSTPRGRAGRHASDLPAINRTGRFVAFTSESRLVRGDRDDHHEDIYIHNRRVDRARLRTRGCSGHNSWAALSNRADHFVFRSADCGMKGTVFARGPIR